MDTLGGRVLKAAQDAVHLDNERQQAVMHAFDQTMELYRNRFISFVLYSEWDRIFRWRDANSQLTYQPSLSAAVEMLRSMRLLRRVRNGILLNDLMDVRMSSAEYFSAVNSIQSCISALERTKEPYILITHLHDQYNVGFHFGRMKAEVAVTKMAECIGSSLQTSLDPNGKVMGGDEGVFVGCLDCRDADNGLCDSCYEKYM
ncbi:hypothetical protein Enr8_06300 [Blastopirellula retiformator]|uniref:Uncharacterized protein n=2 Tax=Blastopirellula retiformator TaxID=2527970 RepID=A0A5C5VJZ2_9BACT|nr:hypothetical protein Enr8_06300 [Blastopirellula retiformator]